MSIERWTITTREEWLKRRKPNINGSEIGALFGCNPFMTRFALHAEKAGHTDGVTRETDAMRRGRVMEPSVALAVAEEHPDWVIEKALDYLWSPEWRLGCTPDFRVTIADRGRGVLQAKTVAWPVFADKWQDGPPQWIVLQTLQEMMLDGAEWGIIAAMVTSSYDYELHLYEFTRHAGAEAKIIAKAGKFWADIEVGRAPKPDYAADGDVIRQIYSKGGGPTIDLTRHNGIGFICEEKLAWLRRHNAAEKALEVIDAEIVDILGDAERGDHPAFNITRKSQINGGYEVPRQKIRVLRVTRKKSKGDDQQEEAA